MTSPGQGFEPLYRDLYRPVFIFLFRLSGKEEEALDLTQEVFLKAYRAITGGAVLRNPRAWIFRIAVNTWRTQLGRGLLWQQAVRRNPGGLPGWGPAGQERSPDAALAARDRDRRIRSAFERLSKGDRLALELRTSGLSYPEISGVMGIRFKSVGKMLFRARHRLADYLKKEGIE
jgi:RNA polymerase sigma-70 factor, ECF subfamily